MTYPCNTCRSPPILSTIRNDGFDQSWDLDALGNWSDVRRDDDGNGTWDLDEQREHNAANEIVEVEGSAANVAHGSLNGSGVFTSSRHGNT